jgi:hypothetical protein
MTFDKEGLKRNQSRIPSHTGVVGADTGENTATLGLSGSDQNREEGLGLGEAGG